MKYKKVEVKNIVKLEEKPLKYWIYKIPNRFFLTPIPYEKPNLTKEINKLIKFCKN